MSEPIAATIYANQLINQREGYPVWEPDPQDEPAVEIADVGYFKNGAFVRLFNASKELGDTSNKFGVPELYSPLEVGEIQKRNSLPANVPIRSESVMQRGAKATLSAGTFIQAGGGFSFECAKQEGAVLILGDGADRRDALRLPPFFRYMSKHHSSWLTFANEARQRGIGLNDLILVTGCDLTSAWACAAFSGKSNQAEVSFQVGPVGVAQGGISIWGAWSNCSSVTARWGPQNRFSSMVPQINPPHTQDSPRNYDGAALMEGSHHNTPSLLPLLPRNQCVFLRGYRICDKQTMLARLFLRKRRKPAYDGFYYISRDKKDEEDPDASGSSREKPTEQPGRSGGGGAQPPSSTRSSGAGGTGSSGSESGGSGRSEVQSLPSSDDSLGEEYDGALNHFLDKEPTALDFLLEYILDSSSAKVAIVHDNDLVALLQDSPHITDFVRWIQSLAPNVIVDQNQVGMLEATYRSLVFESQALMNLSPLATGLPTGEINKATGIQHRDPSQPSVKWSFPATPAVLNATNAPSSGPRLPDPQSRLLPPIRAVIGDLPDQPPSHVVHAFQASRESQYSILPGHSTTNEGPAYSVYRSTPEGLVLQRTSTADDYAQRKSERVYDTSRYQSRSHVCEECGQRFDKLSSLNAHGRTHTGEKPFTCSVPGCGKRFSDKSNMRRHERTHEAASAFTFESDPGEEGRLPSSSHSVGGGTSFSTQPSSS